MKRGRSMHRDKSQSQADAGRLCPNILQSVVTPGFWLWQTQVVTRSGVTYAAKDRQSCSFGDEVDVCCAHGELHAWYM